MPNPRFSRARAAQELRYSALEVEKLREMRSMMRVNLLNPLMSDSEGIFI